MIPELIDTDGAVKSTLCAAEEGLMDVAASLVSQGLTGPVADHHKAVTLANELLWAHESGSPADEVLFLAATQLKLWHLNQLAITLASL